MSSDSKRINQSEHEEIHKKIEGLSKELSKTNEELRKTND